MPPARSRTLAAALFVVATTLAAALPATAAPAGVKLQAERALGAGVRVQVHRGTGRVSWLSGTAARPVATAASLGRPATALAASRAFLDRHAALFGVPRPGRDLAVSEVSRTGGRTFVRFQQEYRGLPVVAGELIVQVARNGDIISVNGEASPGLSLATRPAIGAGRAQRLAVAATASIEQVRARGLRASAPELVVYDPALAGDPTRLPGARLAWRMDVRGGRGLVNEWMVIDAQRGTVLGAFNQVMEAAPPADATQRICDEQGARATDAANDTLFCDPGDATLVANPGSSGVTDVTLTFAATEAAYDFYARRFGRNSINGTGMPLISSVRFCFPSLATACPYLNAQWNGTQMLYGAGWALGDDVVAHELTHGVTSATSKLLYWFQSGAINESLSDIFGELTDQQNGLGTDTPGVRWLLGEDMPGGAIRNMADPGASVQGASADRMRSPNYYSDPSLVDRGAVHFNSGVGNKAAFLMVDGGTFNGQTVTGIGVDKTAAIWYRAASQAALVRVRLQRPRRCSQAGVQGPGRHRAQEPERGRELDRGHHERQLRAGRQGDHRHGDDAAAARRDAHPRQAVHQRRTHGHALQRPHRSQRGRLDHLGHHGGVGAQRRVCDQPLHRARGPGQQVRVRFIDPQQGHQDPRDRQDVAGLPQLPQLPAVEPRRGRWRGRVRDGADRTVEGPRCEVRRGRV